MRSLRTLRAGIALGTLLAPLALRPLQSGKLNLGEVVISERIALGTLRADVAPRTLRPGLSLSARRAGVALRTLKTLKPLWALRTFRTCRAGLARVALLTLLALNALRTLRAEVDLGG